MFYFSKVYNNLTDFKFSFVRSWSALFSERLLRFYGLFLVLSQLLNWYLAYYIYSHLNGRLLILHYNVDFGADLIGPAERIFWGPVSGLFLIIINLGLALFVVHFFSQRLVSRALLFGALMWQGFLTISLFTIYLNNFR